MTFYQHWRRHAHCAPHLSSQHGNNGNTKSTVLFEYEANVKDLFWKFKKRGGGERTSITSHSIDPSEIRIGHRLINSIGHTSDLIFSVRIPFRLKAGLCCIGRWTCRYVQCACCTPLFQFARKHGKAMRACCARLTGRSCMLIRRFLRCHAFVIIIPTFHFIVCLWMRTISLAVFWLDRTESVSNLIYRFEFIDDLFVSCACVCWIKSELIAMGRDTFSFVKIYLPGFCPIGGTPLTSSKLILSGDRAEIAREIPIFECRMRCSIKSAPTNSSFGSMRIGMIMLMM